MTMRRKLYIIRHGKSSWDHEGLADRDRPLAPRGIRNAGEMARRLERAGMVPERIYSSPANRALSTARIMADTWDLPDHALQVEDILYMAWEDDIYGVIAQAPPELESLAIFGHNPSFTDFANDFLDPPIDNLPTAGVVVVTLESDSWAGIGRPGVVECLVDYPKKAP